jgi:hypothetical protein
MKGGEGLGQFKDCKLFKAYSIPWGFLVNIPECQFVYVIDFPCSRFCTSLHHGWAVLWVSVYGNVLLLRNINFLKITDKYIRHFHLDKTHLHMAHWVYLCYVWFSE